MSPAHISPDTKVHHKHTDREEDVVPQLPIVKQRLRTSSNSSLNEIYQRHRHRSRSRRPEAVIIEPDESSTDEEPNEVFAGTSKPKPFIYRFGRRYLAESEYLLPSDLRETQRQNLSTILTTTALGGPLCLPLDPLNPPRTILELGCGDGYWSTVCHDFFICLGMPPPAFTGLDIAREGPNLRSFGLDWRFVNHDITCGMFPFPDNYFDVVFSKDMAFSLQAVHCSHVISELCRITKPGGFMEFRDRDYDFRRMISPRLRHGVVAIHDEVIAKETGCYLIDSKTEFTEPSNKFLAQAGNWTRQLMEQNDCHPCPVAGLASMEGLEGWEQFGIKKIAIPLSKAISWEYSSAPSSPLGFPPKRTTRLTAEQKDLRSTALEVVIGLIESLEPSLRKTCGKTEEEWRRWWNAMIANLVEDDGADGECLEIGTSWCRKSPR